MKQGDKVLCVNSKNLLINPNSFDIQLVEGAIYCVREMVPGYEFKGQPDGVILEEIKGKIGTLECYDGIERTLETHFRQDRFRVIDEIDVCEFEESKKELIENKIYNNARE